LLLDDEGNIDVARVLHCVGEPKRQIEDPQSPPCVPCWPVDADNGGDLSPGILDGEIRIGVPVKFADAQLRTLEAFFNSRFLDYQSIMSDAELAKLSPYIWQYPMDTERQLANLGEWACRRLVPGRARHAGPTLSGAERKFGVIVFEDFGSHTDVAPLRNEPAACDQGDVPVQVIQGESDPETQYNDALLGMSKAVWIKRTYPKLPMNRLSGDDPWLWAATENDQGYGWDKFDNPIKAGRAGFTGGHSGQGPGTMCYIDAGDRHSSGNWPARAETLFDGPCVSGDQPATR
jgi:hypothetical protein